MPRPSRQSRSDAKDTGGTAGRSLPGGPSAPTNRPNPTGAVGGMLPAAPGQTPFASAQVELGVNVAPSQANSNRVLTILLALGFTGGMSLFVAALLLIVGWFVYRDQQDRLAKAEQGDDPETHVRDSGNVEDPDIKSLVRRQAAHRAALIEENRDEMAEMFGGIGAGPVTVYKEGPGSEPYDQIEVICGMVQPTYRKRAPFIGGKAHIPIVPAARCRLNFQGGVPVKSWVTGGDVRRCTFNPIVCR